MTRGNRLQFQSTRACLLLFALSILLSLACPAYAQSIDSWMTTLNLNSAGKANVEETLQVEFPTGNTRTQFYRVIPLWSDVNGKSNVSLVHVNSVTLDGKEPLSFTSWIAGRDLYVKIGDNPLSGKHQLKINYEIQRAVSFASGFPQLRFDFTGSHCPFPIKVAELTVNLPKGTSMPHVKAKWSVNTGDFHIDGKTALMPKMKFFASRVKPGETVALLLDLPDSAVTPHSVVLDLAWYLERAYQIFVLPVATILVLSTWWWFYGRDPGAKRDEESQSSWYPPDYLTPAEAGTVIDESCDLRDLVSTMIDLAVRGYIRIRVLPYNGFLYLTNKDYEVELLKSVKDRELKPHEQVFLVAIFGLSNTNYISAIKGTFSEYLPVMRQKVYASLVTGGIFARDPEIDRKNFLGIGAGVVTLGFALMVASAYHLNGQATAIGTTISGLIFLVAASAMPRRTSKGVSANMQMKQFYKAVVTGSPTEFKNLAVDDPTLFQKYLPYAIVLGLSDKWASLFVDSVRRYPDWFQIDESLAPGVFNSMQFALELQEGLSVINRALTDQAPDIPHTENVLTLTGSRWDRHG